MINYIEMPVGEGINFTYKIHDAINKCDKYTQENIRGFIKEFNIINKR